MNAQGVEDLRLDLMGIGLSGDAHTAEKRRLRTLVLAAPLVRRFDSDRPDVRELRALQLSFLEARTKFITARDKLELPALAADLIVMDSQLSRSQSVAYLGDDLEDVP